MKITKIKITYLNGDNEEIQLGKKWINHDIKGGCLTFGAPNKMMFVPLTSIQNLIVEEKDNGR